MENDPPFPRPRESGGDGAHHRGDGLPRIPESGDAVDDPVDDPVDSDICPRENEGENRQEGAAGNPLANRASEVWYVHENLASGDEACDIRASNGETGTRSHRVVEIDQMTENAGDVAIHPRMDRDVQNGLDRSSPYAMVHDGDHTVSHVDVDRVVNELDASHMVSGVCVDASAARMASVVVAGGLESEVFGGRMENEASAQTQEVCL